MLPWISYLGFAGSHLLCAVVIGKERCVQKIGTTLLIIGVHNGTPLFTFGIERFKQSPARGVVVLFGGQNRKMNQSWVSPSLIAKIVF
jgi:hypothetical protein